MNLKEYAEKLNQLVENNPEAAEFIVVTSKDDEGNGFNPVHYDPSIGYYRDREFSSVAEAKERGDELNAVCLN